MTHKTMFFIALLVSATSTYCVESIAMQIQQLKNDCLKKRFELSDLGKTIDDKDTLIRKLDDAIDTLALELIREKKKSLNLNEEAVKEFRQTLNASIEKFEKDLDEAIISKKNVKQFFVKEFFNENNRRIKDFSILKFCLTRNAFELDFLKILIERYEECQQELIEINGKLADLQKLVLHN